MIQKITFITTGQPTTNPRLVKEAEALNKLGYQVKVICCFYQSWAQKFDQEIINRNPGLYLFCGGDPGGGKSRYYYTRLRQKVYSLLFRLTQNFGVPENAISRTHSEGRSIAKKIKSDLYIAHNLGALPAAAQAAKFNKAKLGYDAEDMHSAQFSSVSDKLYLLNKLIEEKYFPCTDYFTAASPLIASHYKQLYPFLSPVVIDNVFPKVMPFPIKRPDPAAPLKLFWFSQTIGADRGIEAIITAMASGKKKIQLHLLGGCNDQFRLQIKNIATGHGLGDDQIQIHEPVSPNQLFSFATQFDIGMATETGIPLNRDICLTNKIFTYIQCGLALIASDTLAQVLFMKRYPNSGKLYEKNNASSLADQINAYAENPELLYQTRLMNYQLGLSTLNWEKESLKFIDVVADTLKSSRKSC